MTLEQLGLPISTYAILKNNQIHTLEELLGMTERDLIKIKQIGQKKLQEIQKCLFEKGLALKKQEHLTKGQRLLNDINKKIDYHKHSLQELYLQKELLIKSEGL